MGLVSGGVKGGSVPGGLNLYCCPHDLEYLGTMETFLP